MYHCEYCNKSFQDNDKARKRHLYGTMHVKNKQMYYNEVIYPSAVAQSRGNVELLWSNMSGEDMSKEWLSQHPQVAERQKAKDSSQKTDKSKTTNLPKKPKETAPSTLAILPHVKDLAKELDTYEREHGGLPVSLMPSSRQPPSLHSLEAVDWG